MRVGVVSRTDIDAVFPVTRRVIQLLEEKGVEVTGRDRDGDGPGARH